MVDLIALAAIALAAFLGWRTGLLAALLACGGVVLAYGLAWLLYAPLGNLLADSADIPPLFAYPIVGIGIVTVVMIAVGLYRRRHVKRRRARTFRNWDPPVWDQLGGAVVAGVWSSALVLVVVWVLGSLRVAVPTLPDAGDSVVGAVAGRLAGRLASVITERRTGDAGLARTAEALARNPAEAPQALGNVLKNKKVQKLLRERWAVAGARRNQLADLARDRELLDQAYAAGLLQNHPGTLTQEAAAAELDASLAPLARGMKELGSDPEMKRLLNDPQLMRRLQNGDVAALARDPRFNRLARELLTRMGRAAAEPAP